MLCLFVLARARRGFAPFLTHLTMRSPSHLDSRSSDEASIMIVDDEDVHFCMDQWQLPEHSTQEGGPSWSRPGIVRINRQLGANRALVKFFPRILSGLLKNLTDAQPTFRAKVRILPPFLCYLVSLSYVKELRSLHGVLSQPLISWGGMCAHDAIRMIVCF